MRTYLLAAAAAVAIASPAAARDGSAYVGIEGGVMFPKDHDADVFVDFSRTQVPTTPAVPSTVLAPAVDTTFEDMFSIDYDMGYDIDLIAGYDFGMFRIEGEIGYKRASIDQFEVDDSDIAALNVALNRPDTDTAAGTVGTLPALVAADVEVDGRISVLSGMINGLVDFGDEDGISFYAGGGFGRARAKFAGESDSAWAWQLIAGLRYAISSNIDVGLKYRYFSTGSLELSDPASASAAFVGNADRVTFTPTGATAPVNVDVTTTALLFPDFEQKFRSHSLLASLIFNFGAPEMAPPPPPPPAPERG